MYADHQPKLAALVRRGYDGLARIATFALLSIRQPLYDAIADYPLVRAGERKVRSLWGHKFEALDYIDRHAPELWERCEEAFDRLTDEDAENVIVGILCEIPNIGTAKAGFIAQMGYGLSGCIDGQNHKRFGLPDTTWRLRKDWKPERQRAFVRDYNAFCRRKGGTAQLWDDWCRYVSERDPVNYRTPDYVSELHLAPLRA